MAIQLKLFKSLRNDLFAGFTVALIALPLSVAIAIASNLPPKMGLIAGIIGGSIISIFGGSRFQIGGVAGAFIGVISSIIAKHGLEGLFIITFISGICIALLGVLGLGKYIKRIPDSVIEGFTVSIAFIIIISQLPIILGLKIDTSETLGVLFAIFNLFYKISPTQIGLFFIGVASYFILSKISKKMPIYLTLCMILSLIVSFTPYKSATLFQSYGHFPSQLFQIHLISFEKINMIGYLPDIIIVTLLGAIESLLSARAADLMTDTNHHSNQELIGQGLANILSPLLGGMVVTGTIARTAVNIQAGAKTSMAGLFHALILMIFVVLFPTLLEQIPLIAFSTILFIVSVKMMNIQNLRKHLINRQLEIIIPFFITFFVSIIFGILQGVMIGILAHIIVIKNKH